MASSSTPSADYDIIFAGGGTAACVTAGRLATAEPSLKILIIEAGPHTRNLQEHVQPARYLRNMVPTSKIFSFHIAQSSQDLAGRSVIVPSGRCLGGGSSVNFLMYTRAAASDYDDWEIVYGNEGWGSRDLIPLLKKVETFQVTPNDYEDVHGNSGPIKVSYGGYYTNVGQQFLQVAKTYDKTRDSTNDVNNFYSCNIYGRWPKYIDINTGRRSDTAHNFIYNQDHKNLHVLTGCRVIQVILRNNQAIGVEFTGDTGSQVEPRAVYASKLVVLAAGAFGSPAILQRSGIGPAAILEKYEVPVLVDLPGVGDNYNDHNLVFTPFYASDEAETLDPIFRGEEDAIEEYVSQWQAEGNGLMAHNAFDAGIKLRPHEEDLRELGPEFEKRWNDYFSNAPDKPVMWLGVSSGYTGMEPVHPHRKYMSIEYFTEYPISTGKLHITSGKNTRAPLYFEPGYLKNPADVSVLRWAYKKGRELVRRISLYRGEVVEGHPAFLEGSAAACSEALGPVAADAPDIVYTSTDDEAIDAFHRKTVETTWHSLGTCAMKPREQGGVVDSKLNVYGVLGLKVADLSICPSNVGANTYNTALAVGEKAAVIIALELGIEL